MLRDRGGHTGSDDAGDIFLDTLLHPGEEPTSGYSSPDIVFGKYIPGRSAQSFSGGRSGYFITAEGMDKLESYGSRSGLELKRGLESSDLDMLGDTLKYILLKFVSEYEPTYSNIVTFLGSMIEEETVRAVVRHQLSYGYIKGPKI